MNLKDLQQGIPYKWRQGPGGTQLAYIDARDAQELLDKVVGPDKWQSDFKLIDSKLFGGVGIEVEPDKWVWKWDCGTESNIEEEKGQVSDAFKRACVQWGVGRFLYDLKPATAKKVYKEEPQDHLEFPTENKFKDINKIQDYCTICAKGVSLAAKKYCIEKNMPIMCYDCQKGKTIASKKKMAS
jgi:hypothetical protein